METNKKSLAGAVNVLAAKTALLDPNHLDHVEGRLAALQHKLTRLSDSSSSLDTADNKTKLDELDDITSKSRGMYEALPEVIDRQGSIWIKIFLANKSGSFLSLYSCS